MADEAPTTPEAPATPAEQPAAPSPGPWQHDIEQTFQDPRTQAQVDAFLRSKVQPRMTQLEQQVAQATDATELYNAFTEDPVGAYNAVKQQLLDAGYLEAEAAQVAGEAAQEAAAVQPPAEQGYHDPRLDEIYSFVQEQKMTAQQQADLAAYDAKIAEIAADPANADIEIPFLHKHIALADGDYDRGIELYREEQGHWASKYGAPREPGDAPAVAGADAGAAAGTPVTPDYHGLDGVHKAIEDATAAAFGKRDAPPIS